jgi:hypothetical protein
MMQNTNLKVLHVVSNIPDYGQCHHKKAKLNVVNLPLKLLTRSTLCNLLYLLLLLLFLSQLFLLFFLWFLALLFSPFQSFLNLVGNFLIAIVNNFNEEVSTLVNSRSMEHQNLQNIKYNSLMINS